MSIRKVTEEFLNALSGAYFSSRTNGTAEFLQGEYKLLSLLNLDTEKKWQPGELSKRLDVSTARIASTLKTLERKNLIRRESSSDDKRKVYVSITEEGSVFVENKREQVCEFFDKALSTLEQSEREEFIRIIKKLSDSSASNN